MKKRIFLALLLVGACVGQGYANGGQLTERQRVKQAFIRQAILNAPNVNEVDKEMLRHKWGLGQEVEQDQDLGQYVERQELGFLKKLRTAVQWFLRSVITVS